MDNKGEWLQWRHDTRRTGHSGVPGRITDPGIECSAFAGAYEDYISLQPGGAANLSLGNVNGGGFDEDAVRRDFGMDLYLDVEGTGAEEKVEENIMVRYIKKESGKGYLRVRFEYAFENDRWGSDEPTYGYLEEREDGEWRTIWRTEADKTAFWRPNLLLADIDNDGTDEIITTEKGRLIAYDFRTGAKIRDLRYHNSRNYGEYFAYDFTGNGYPDFFSIVHFPAHAEVILNDGKEFSCAWIDKVQETIADTGKLLVTVINPICDLDGNGRPDIIFSRYNQHGDSKWHTTVLEPVTGALRYSMPDFVAMEILPTGINESPQIYGYRTSGSYINPEANAAIYEIRDGAPREVFHDKGMFWFSYFTRTPFSACIPRTKMASPDGRMILCGEKKDNGNCRVTLREFTGDAMRILGEATLPSPAVQYVSDDGRILIKTSRTEGFEASAAGFGMTLLGTREVPGRPYETGVCEKGRRNIAYGITPELKVGGAPVVFVAGGEPRIALPDLLNKSICCFRYKDGKLEQLWRRPGFGMELGAGVAVRRDGGGRTILYGSSGPDGVAMLTEASPDGEPLARITIDSIPAPVINPLTAYFGMGPASWL
ncbi:MAG: hypothetical protein JXB33_06240, partial [Clostridia bacterium]|nr:hypothetical protein [Clostridia bacterium]